MEHKYKALYLFSGIGGGALGFQSAKEEYKGITGTFETLCGIDCDKGCCEDFEYLTGAKSVQMDLFDRKQYIAFHGQEPSEDWKEATHFDIRNACGGIAPDIVFTSPPCKGFSGLLPEKSAKSEKYQALNQLVIRGLFLTLEAFREDLPALILLENVPRIKSRGAKLLHQIKSLLNSYGYVFSEGLHDCGEIGGLGQHRKRFLLICRNPKKIPGFVYQPPKQRIKSIGEILGPLPLPDEKSAGPMHKLPRLQWKTWVRLALIPAGGDWRDLNNLNYEPRNGAYKIVPWDCASSTVTAATKGVGSSNGVSAVADPRIENVQGYGNKYQVTKWKDSAPTITGSRIGSGAPMVADIRLNDRKKRYPGVYKVNKWSEASSTIIGQTDIQCGALSVNDPRIKENRHTSHFKVVPWAEPSGTVTGATHVANGLISVQDPRGPKWKNGWKCTGAVGKVNNWDEPTDVVLGHSSARGNGASNVADPRFKCTQRAGTMEVMTWDKSANIYSGSAAVADPRIPAENESGVWIIISTDNTWHRPLTTFELAILQGLPTTIHGKPLVLSGKSDASWRERIGNMVPVQAATAIANQMLMAMLPTLKDEIVLGITPIWVIPESEGNVISEIVN